MSIPTIVGDRIRVLRKERKWSQEELAHLAGLHPKYIGQIERAEKNVTLESLIKLTAALNITLEDLFRHIQPTKKGHEQTAVGHMVNLLMKASSKDQKYILKHVEEMLEWKHAK